MIVRIDFPGRWNWIDDKNTVIGYDSSSCCCENFYYYYTKMPNSLPSFEDGNAPGLPTKEIEENLQNYIIDKNYCVDGTPENENPDNGVGASEKVFRFIYDGWKDEKNETFPPIYLHLYNSHNGYYGHGFDLRPAGEALHEGTL